MVILCVAHPLHLVPMNLRLAASTTQLGCEPAVPLLLAVESDFLGATVSEELVPGGSRLAVTQGNLLQVRARCLLPGCAASLALLQASGGGSIENAMEGLREGNAHHARPSGFARQLQGICGHRVCVAKQPPLPRGLPSQPVTAHPPAYLPAVCLPSGRLAPQQAAGHRCRRLQPWPIAGAVPNAACVLRRGGQCGLADGARRVGLRRTQCSMLLSHCCAQVIPSSWLRLFSPREVNQLLGGGEASALDIDDMQAHAVYRCWGGGVAL